MQKFLSFFSAMLLCGCAVTVRAPLTRFESPETRGKGLGAELLWGYQARTDVRLTNDFTTTPPDMVNPYINDDPSHRLMAAGAVGVLERLDAELSLPDARFGLKYQLLGDTKLNAKEGNFALSVLAGISKRSEDETGSNWPFPGQVTYKLFETQADAGVVAGYRLKDNLRVNAGLYYLWDRLKTQYSNPSTSAAKEDFAILRNYNFNFGLDFEIDKCFIRPEFSISDTSLGRKKDTVVTYGLAGGANF